MLENLEYGHGITNMQKQIITILLVSLFSGVAVAQQPLVFEHKIRNPAKQRKISLSTSVPAMTLSIARINDLMVPEKSTFDEKAKHELSAIIDSKDHVLLHKSYRRPPGFDKQIREILSFYLSKTPGVKLIERANINSVLREWEFSTSKYVKKSDQLNAGIEVPELIATGYLSTTALCELSDNVEQQWDGENEDGFDSSGGWQEQERRRELNAQMMPYSSHYAKAEKSDHFYFLLRVYETQTSHIKYVACGKGRSIEQAVKKATQDFGCFIVSEGDDCY